MFLVIVVVVELTGESEIGHLDNAIVCQKDIASRQITVQNLFTHKEIHSTGDLKGPTDQIASGNGTMMIHSVYIGD